MANPYRGEAHLELASLEFGGRRITLRLTLNALAELESGFGVEGLAALGQRLATGTLAARDIVRLLGPLVRAGGEGISDAALGAAITARELPEVVRAIADCFAAAMPEEERQAARP